MFMLRLYRYMTSYVKFKTSGGFPERFFNLAAAKKITIWETDNKNGEFSGYVFAKEYKRLRPMARKAGVRLKVTERHGTRFILYRYRHRWGLPAGFLLFFFTIWFLSLFIWNINVVGNTTVKTENVMRVLNEAGIVEGKLRSSIDANNMRPILLMKMPELSWLAVNMEGATATIDVRETVKAPPKTAEALPSNIKAARDGRVLKVKTYEGTTVVKPGEAVVKGDLLVSGTVALTNGMTVFKDARADVIAETVREASFFVPFSRTEQKRSDRADTRRIFSVLWLKIPLYLGEQPGDFEKEASVWQPEIEGVKLPISMKTVKFYPIETTRYTINADTAKKIANEKAKEYQSNVLKGLEAAETSRNYTVKKDGIELEISYLCKENISVKENILIK